MGKKRTFFFRFFFLKKSIKVLIINLLQVVMIAPLFKMNTFSPDSYLSGTNKATSFKGRGEFHSS